MKKTNLRIIACLAFAAFAFYGWSQEQKSIGERMKDTGQSAVDKTQQAGERVWGAIRGERGEPTSRLSTSVSLPPGIEQKELRGGEGIRDVLRVATESALTQGGFDDLVDQFVEGDRHRINQSVDNLTNKEQLNDSWNQACEQFKAQYKSKFGHDFDIKDGESVYGGSIHLTEGVITDPSQLSSWPVGQMGGPLSGMREGRQPMSQPGTQPGTTGQMGTTDQPGAAGTTGERTGAAADRLDQARQTWGASYDTPNEANLEKGREVAVAVFPAGAAMREFAVSFIHEKPDFWKIDVPNNIDGAQLYSNLTQHINQLTQNVASWPSDEMQVQRIVTYHILQACYGMPATGRAWGGSMRDSLSGSPSGAIRDSQSQFDSQSGASGMGSQSGTQGRTGGGTQGQSTQGSESRSNY